MAVADMTPHFITGGAYGGFCSFSRYSGLFTFGSYRDPNLVRGVGRWGLGVVVWWGVWGACGWCGALVVSGMDCVCV